MFEQTFMVYLKTVNLRFNNKQDGENACNYMHESIVYVIDVCNLLCKKIC